MKIVLATCARWPDLSVSDAELARELSALGHSVEAQAWNVASADEFTSADIVVLRSNWDFHHEMESFDRWLTALDSSPVMVQNPVPLVREYLDKSYLGRLNTAGFPTPASTVVHDHNHDGDHVHDHGHDGDLDRWIDSHGFDRVVVKPLWGASGHEVELVMRDDLPEHVRRRGAQADRRPLLVQEFIPEIRGGEYSLVYFDNVFSHALHRSTGGRDFRVNSQYGSTMSAVDAVRPEMIDLGHRVIDTFPAPAVYARIDMVDRGADPILMEVEVNEPAIGLHLAPGSASRFAAAVTSRPSTRQRGC